MTTGMILFYLFAIALTGGLAFYYGFLEREPIWAWTEAFLCLINIISFIVFLMAS